MENKLIHSYVVEEYSNGDRVVKDAGAEGTEALNNEEIYSDIERVAELIKRTRESNLIRTTVYEAIKSVYSAAANATEERSAEPQPDRPEVEMPKHKGK